MTKELDMIVRFLGSKKTAAILKVAAINASVAIINTLTKGESIKQSKILSDIAEDAGAKESKVLLEKIKRQEEELARLKK